MYTHTHTTFLTLGVGSWATCPSVDIIIHGGSSVGVEPSWGHGYRSRDSQAITGGACTCGRLCYTACREEPLRIPGGLSALIDLPLALPSVNGA